MDLICVVYSHTEFLEILKIQTDYIKKLKNVKFVLFIDENAKNLNLDYLFNMYNNVYFYDDKYPYGHRLSKCIDYIESEYILFLHDIDILIHYDDLIFKKLLNILKNNNIDRLDLKIFGGWEGNKDNLTYKLFETDDEKIILDSETQLIKQKNTNCFIYNVNPSIWKTNTFKEIHNRFNYKNYRNIENFDVQLYCTKFRIFKISTKNYIECGYFTCAKFFIYLHITHGGDLLPLGDGLFKTEFGQSFKELSSEYTEIVEKYKMKETKHGGRIK